MKPIITENYEPKAEIIGYVKLKWQKMDAKQAIGVLEMVEAHGLANDAKKVAIDALRKLSYLTDRPCAACKFNEDGNGCKKWTCVFEDDGKENE